MDGRRMLKVIGLVVFGLSLSTGGHAAGKKKGLSESGKEAVSNAVPAAEEKVIQEQQKETEKNDMNRQPGGKEKTAVIETTLGTIKINFYSDIAPKTVENFITLANKKFYDGLIFHRVIKGFMIQGGCPLGTGTGDPGYKIKAEFNEKKHLPGTVAMARAQDPDSAGSQFYICLEACPFLDGKYTVFGQVVEGMDVVKKIGGVQTSGNQSTGNFRQPFDKPVQDVIMKKVYITE